MENLITIKENVEGKIVEKKSKFLSFLYKIETKEEAEEILKEFRKKYYDAKHCCYAYRVIENKEIYEKASDDGEPSGTAGAPMLSILKNNNLCNVIIIVIRYFGGILLGTGGLVRAYSDSLINLIEISEKIENKITKKITVEMDYPEFEKSKYFCEKNQINIINPEFNQKIKCILEYEIEKEMDVLEYFNTKIIKT